MYKQTRKLRVIQIGKEKVGEHKVESQGTPSVREMLLNDLRLGLHSSIGVVS